MLGQHALDVVVLDVGNRRRGRIGADRVGRKLATLQRGVDGLFRVRDGGIAPPDPEVRLQSGALEGSNVNGAEVLVNMIELARNFEMQMRTIRAVEENGRSAQNLLSING